MFIGAVLGGRLADVAAAPADPAPPQ
jgi:hypothetical protein